MQSALGRAGVVRRHQLRPRQIGEEQLVRDREAAAFRPPRQMMAARDPELPHGFPPPIMPTRSTRSPGSSSLSTNSKARAWACRRSGAARPVVAHMQRAELLLDRAALDRPVHGEDRVDRVLAQGAPRRRPPPAPPRAPLRASGRRTGRRSAAPAPRPLRRARRARLRDDDEGREPERAHADEPGAEGGAAFAGQGGDIRVPEQEGAGDGPFARLRGCSKTRVSEGSSRIVRGSLRP